MLISETRGVTPRQIAMLDVGRLEAFALTALMLYLGSAFVGYIAVTTADSAANVHWVVVSLAWDGICNLYLATLVAATLLVRDNRLRRGTTAKRFSGSSLAGLPGAAPRSLCDYDEAAVCLDSPKDIERRLCA